jgi:hypothetical protein
MGHETYGGEEGDKAQENKSYPVGIRDKTSKTLRRYNGKLLLGG